jgi:hypothetical protein
MEKRGECEGETCTQESKDMHDKKCMEISHFSGHHASKHPKVSNIKLQKWFENTDISQGHGSMMVRLPKMQLFCSPHGAPNLQ